MDQQIRVLVVDDDEPHAEAVAESLERWATSRRRHQRARGLRLIEEQTFDIIITDLIMEGVGGLEILAKANASCPTPRSSFSRARHHQDRGHRHAGRRDHLPDQAARHRRAPHGRRQGLAIQRLARSNIELQRQLNEKFGFEGVIGNSQAMHTVVARLRQIAPPRPRS